MAKIIYRLGILAMVLVFGMIVVGCGDSAVVSENEFLIKNQSSHTIVIVNIGTGGVGVGISPTNFTLTPGGEQLIRSENNFMAFTINWHRQDTNDRTGVEWSSEWGSVRTGTFRNN